MTKENSDARERYHGIRVGVLAAGPTTGVIGGAERLNSGLVGGLEQIGCRAELVSIPADEPDFDTIMANYDRCAQLDVSRFDVIISTKAPTYAVSHPRHVLYLVHTVRVFDDMFARVFPNPDFEVFKQRARIHARDFEAMTRVKARFAIGHEVADRLYRWRGLHAEVIHPPLGVSGFKCGPSGDFFFLPGRLHEWKRIDLVIEAIRRSTLPMRLLIAGTGEAESNLRALAAGDSRIEFLGRIDDSTLIDLFSRALAVPFVPEREDYGYITLEAFASGKPVITCIDSGEPARIVIDGVSGRVCAPDPDDICKALEYVFENRGRAQEMGQQGLAWVSGMRWTDTARKLVDAALSPAPEVNRRKLRVAVLDMQPIDPPVGGGRLRLLGLYHNLGEDVDCTYVGTYDWPGESFRQLQLTPGLKEIDVPLSPEHHAASASLSAQAGGKTVIDIAFGRQGALSPDYLRVARETIRQADVVVFSHPWVFPLLEQDLQPGQTVVYDSHNVEGYLRAQLLDESNPVEADLLRGVVEDELRLCQRADLVLACSQEDLLRFNRLYRIHGAKLRVVPNGVMAFAHPVPQDAERMAIREKLGVNGWPLIAIFIGSAYRPNVEAAHFIEDQLAPKCDDVLFVIAGGVGTQIVSSRTNVRITGPLDEPEKIQWLTAADLAVNPMFSGSGTNIKMFDFMAFGLPVVTTETGARGISSGPEVSFKVTADEPTAFVRAIEELKFNPARVSIGKQARLCVERKYAWERISAMTGGILKARNQFKNQPLPFFSVVIVSASNKLGIQEYIDTLSQQIERDFELIVVDIGTSSQEVRSDVLGFPVRYLRACYLESDGAKTLGASLSSGTWIVFSDDRDRPAADWLLQVRTAVESEGKSLAGILTPGYFEANFPSPRAVLKSEAFHLGGGFVVDERIRDLAQPYEFFSRMRELGRLVPSRFLGGDLATVGGNRSVVMLSTAGHKCGIGEYSLSLAQALSQIGFDLQLISCRTASTGYPSCRSIDSVGWDYDDIHYEGSSIYNTTSRLIEAVKPSVILIQYHPAFFSTQLLEKFLEQCGDFRSITMIDNHRFKPEDAASFKRLIATGVKVSLHRHAECVDARASGLDVLHLPIGIQNNLPEKPRSIYGRDWSKSPPRLVTTGFLRKHKGIRKLLEILPKLHEIFPGVVLRVQCAEYPSADSVEEIQSCKLLIDQLGIHKHVELDTAFHEKQKLLDLIWDADLALLPYGQSEEGGSAAAADCLSLGLPLIISNASIFEDIRDYTHIVDCDDAAAWLETIVGLLCSPDDYSNLTKRAHDYVSKHEWEDIARRVTALAAI